MALSIHFYYLFSLLFSTWNVALALFFICVYYYWSCFVFSCFKKHFLSFGVLCFGVEYSAYSSATSTPTSLDENRGLVWCIPVSYPGFHLLSFGMFHQKTKKKHWKKKPNNCTINLLIITEVVACGILLDGSPNCEVVFLLRGGMLAQSQIGRTKRCSNLTVFERELTETLKNHLSSILHCN